MSKVFDRQKPPFKNCLLLDRFLSHLPGEFASGISKEIAGLTQVRVRISKDRRLKTSCPTPILSFRSSSSNSGLSKLFIEQGRGNGKPAPSH